MKALKKMLALVAACVTVLAMGTIAFAAGTGSITITPPEGTQSGTTNTYKIYKVFDADGNGSAISYKLSKGTTLEAPMSTYFDVDTAGNVTVKDTAKDEKGELTAEAIAAIAGYVTEDDLVKTVTSTGTTAAVADGLANGYYYITTSTGSAVTIDSTNPNAKVNDKNVVPTVDKKITAVDTGSFDENGKKALAQVGTKVTYTATVQLGKGSKNVVFHDTMGTGLQYNNDAAVTGVEGYTIETTPAEGDTLTIKFADGTTGTATITYSATITSDALQTEPAKNTAKVSYGNNPGTTSEPSSTEVYNAKFTVTKQDGDKKPLADAGFVVKKTVDGADKYYKLENNVVSWVDSIDDATEYKSDANGAVTAFTGLADGTYTLVEKTVPAGYNKAADSTFTVTAHDYTEGNLVQTATVTNNAGTELPSTGGIGTTIFYVLGAVLVIGAGVVLVARKRMSR